MSALRHLRQHRKGGPWFYQRAVPEVLRRRLGCALIEVSLGSDSAATAERRKAAVAPRVQALFERARAGHRVKSAELDSVRAMFGRRGPLTPAEEAAIEHREMVGAYEEMAADPLDAPDSIRGLKWTEPRGYHGQVVDYVDTRDHAAALLREIGVKPTREAVAKVQDRIARANAKALALWDRKLQPPALPGASINRRSGGKAPKLSEAAKQYISERQRDPKAKLTEQTAAQIKTTFRLFADFARDARLDEITREDAADFLDTLARLHRHYGHRPGAAKLALPELARRYPAGEGEGLSNRTLNRHQTALLVLFKWARKRGLLEGATENPFADLAREEGDNPWLPFTADELNALFKGERFEIQPERHSVATARPWIMAIALYSGMRLSEVCELDAENVKHEGKIPYFDITAAKSKAGVRRVPVHSALKARGILKYVKSIGKGPLFPGVTPGGHDNERGHTFTKRFTDFRRDREVDRGRVAFHSFRKNFVRALELAKVDRDRAALVVGHERGFTFRVYNPEGVDMPALSEVVEAVGFPGLRWSRQKPPTYNVRNSDISSTHN